MQNLLKAVTDTQESNTPHTRFIKYGPRNGSNSREDAVVEGKSEFVDLLRQGRGCSEDEIRTLRGLSGAGGATLQELQQISERNGTDMNGSAQASERISQVLSINDIGGQECHPMILSNINNNFNHIDRLSMLRIRNAYSELRQAHLDLVEYIDEQRLIYNELKEQLSAQFYSFAFKIAAAFTSQNSIKNQVKALQSAQQQILKQLGSKELENQRLNKDLSECKGQLSKQQQKNKIINKSNNKNSEQQKFPCSRCRISEVEAVRLSDELGQTEEQIEKLLIQNESLQEYIFDIEQKLVGVDLEVQRRLKEKSRTTQRASSIREDNQELQHLKDQIQNLQQKCRRLEDQTGLESDIRQRQYQIRENELLLQKKEEKIKEHLTRLEELKEANYQRQHEILAAQDNLSKKIAALRNKETELSQWEAELTRKAKETRGLKDASLANQFLSNDFSLQNSGEDLNHSREVSLKSFGKNQAILEDNIKGSPTSQDQLVDYQAYKMRTLNNYEQGFDGKRQHEFTRERHHHSRDVRQGRPSLHIRTQAKQIGQSSYATRSRQNAIEQIGKRYNPHQSNYSREASPYRHLNQPLKGRGNGNSHQYAITKPQPHNYRDVSKSRSTSKGRVAGLTLQGSAQVGRGGQRDNQIGGLGSKLERLREEIKKEIDSIK